MNEIYWIFVILFGGVFITLFGSLLYSKFHNKGKNYQLRKWVNLAFKTGLNEVQVRNKLLNLGLDEDKVDRSIRIRNKEKLTVTILFFILIISIPAGSILYNPDITAYVVNDIINDKGKIYNFLDNIFGNLAYIIIYVFIFGIFALFFNEYKHLSHIRSKKADYSLMGEAERIEKKIQSNKKEKKGFLIKDKINKVSFVFLILITIISGFFYYNPDITTFAVFNIDNEYNEVINNISEGQITENEKEEKHIYIIYFYSIIFIISITLILLVCDFMKPRKFYLEDLEKEAFIESGGNSDFSSVK